MTGWEYKATSRSDDSPLSEQELNAYGAAGFELIGVTATAHEQLVIGKIERRNVLHYFFKRSKVQPVQPAGLPQR